MDKNEVRPEDFLPKGSIWHRLVESCGIEPFMPIFKDFAQEKVYVPDGFELEKKINKANSQRTSNK